MRRESIVFLLLKSSGYYLLYNFCCTAFIFITWPLLDFLAYKFFLAVSFPVGFYFLLFLVARKDGERENNLLKYDRITAIDKIKWLKIGILVFFTISIADIILILCRLEIISFDFLALYRIINGSVYPLALIISQSSKTSNMPVWATFIFILYYLPLPLAVHFGFYSGYQLIDLKSKIMFKIKE